jgi:hypothetical protein
MDPLPDLAPMAELQDAVVERFPDAGGGLDADRLALHTVHKRPAKLGR